MSSEEDNDDAPTYTHTEADVEAEAEADTHMGKSSKKKAKKRTRAAIVSEFVDDEAALSGSDEEEDEEDRHNRNDDEEDEEDLEEDENEYIRDGFVVGEEEAEREERRRRKRRKKQRVGELVDSDDDDDDDGNDDNDDEDDDSSDDDSDDDQEEEKEKKTKNRRIRKKGELDELDEDDLALIREQQQNMRQNVIASDANTLQQALFEDDVDEEDEGIGADDNHVSKSRTNKASSSSSNRRSTAAIVGGTEDLFDEDAMDDFIEDDLPGGGGSGSNRHMGGDSAGHRVAPSELQMNEASEIFGEEYLDFMDQEEDGFDDENFEGRRTTEEYDEDRMHNHSDDDYDEDDDDHDSDALEGDAIDEERSSRRKRRMIRLQKKRERQIRQLRAKFEPAQLIENFLSESDDVIRTTDLPERYLVGYTTSGVGCSDTKDAKDVHRVLYVIERIPAIRKAYEESLVNAMHDDQDTESSLSSSFAGNPVFSSVSYVLEMLPEMEPSFLRMYREDYITVPAVQSHLWEIVDANIMYDQLVMLRSKIDARLHDLRSSADAAANTGTNIESTFTTNDDNKVSSNIASVEALKEAISDISDQLDTARADLEKAIAEKVAEEDNEDLFGGDDDDNDNGDAEKDEITNATKVAVRAQQEQRIVTLKESISSLESEYAKLVTQKEVATSVSVADTINLSPDQEGQQLSLNRYYFDLYHSDDAPTNSLFGEDEQKYASTSLMEYLQLLGEGM